MRKKPCVPKSRVIRRVEEVTRDYRWWTYQAEEPEGGFIEDRYFREEPAFPEAERRPAATRLRNPARSLNARALKNLLYAAGIRGTKLNAAYHRIRNERPLVGGGGPFYLNWTLEDLRAEFGPAVTRAIKRHVAPTYVFLDEFWYYASSDYAAVVERMRTLRKFNAAVATAVQNDGLIIAQGALMQSRDAEATPGMRAVAEQMRALGSTFAASP